MDEFGGAVTNLGDLNGDGINDIAVGAKNDDDGNSNAGCVWILFLKADGTVKHTQKISSTTGGGPAGLPIQARFGEGLQGLGDLDGDGVVDLAVARPVGGALDPSGIWILFLNPDGTVKSSKFNAAGAGTLLSGVGFFSELAIGMALLDNAPGATSILLCASEPTGGPNGEGSVWYMLVNRAGDLVFASEISEGLGGFGGDLDPGDRFGEAIEAVDLDGDGTRDLVVGAPGSSADDAGAGAVYLLRLLAGGSVLKHDLLAEGYSGFTGVVDAGDELGASLADVGDIDGNGRNDILIGAPGDDDGSVDAGAFWRVLLELECSSPGFSFPTNGSGTNASILKDISYPRLGKTWIVSLDPGGHAPSLAAVAVYEQPFNGLFLAGGELLVDVTSPLAASAVVPHSGASVQIGIPIPDDIGLCGLQGTMQGIVLGAPGYELSNALQATAGG